MVISKVLAKTLVTSILSGTLTYLWKFAILIAVGVTTYIIGIAKFDKKDLPL